MSNLHHTLRRDITSHIQNKRKKRKYTKKILSRRKTKTVGSVIIAYGGEINSTWRESRTNRKRNWRRNVLLRLLLGFKNGRDMHCFCPFPFPFPVFLNFYFIFGTPPPKSVEYLTLIVTHYLTLMGATQNTQIVIATTVCYIQMSTELQQMLKRRTGETSFTY